MAGDTRCGVKPWIGLFRVHTGRGQITATGASRSPHEIASKQYNISTDRSTIIFLFFSLLQSKQSPVEDLLNQADQLISTQKPRAEVYAAMAESLGLAWRDLNAHLETRKNMLDMSVAFHT